MRDSGYIILCFVLIYLSPKFIQHTARADDALEKPPYGYWWLLNPEEIKSDLIAGMLLACKKGEEDSCGGKELMMVLLEKNTGHGCTDYVAIGFIKQSITDKKWDFYFRSDRNNDLELWGTALRIGDRLSLIDKINGRNLDFELSTPDTMEEKTTIACEKSLRSK